jgi:hypothetical protein
VKKGDAVYGVCNGANLVRSEPCFLWQNTKLTKSELGYRWGIRRVRCRA